MRQHLFPEGQRFCLYCGALHHQQMTATCVERPDPPTAPEPRRRLFAVDDFDAIHAAREALKPPQDPDPPPITDGCCA